MMYEKPKMVLELLMKSDDVVCTSDTGIYPEGGDMNSSNASGTWEN